ncbi:MAG TPA: glycoside hydrolase family 15 protein [Pirellulales bacterium]|nr:glycoside hydrolase family 15 protein [Pirellulales bacterium]
MAELLNSNPASGGPGIPPRWTRANKDGVGTAYSDLSRVWFTISRGTVNEVSFPTIDRPQIRDMQLLVTDGETFFHDGRRHASHQVEAVAPHALGYRMRTHCPEGRYTLTREVISDPHRPCLLMQVRLDAPDEILHKLQLYVLLAPHLDVGGWSNNGNVALTPQGQVLTAHKNGIWLALQATVPFTKTSCGYVGSTDGWQDLARDFHMDWQFDSVTDGNIALTGQLDLSATNEFTMVLSFGYSLHQALVALAQSMSQPFDDHRQRFIEQWSRAADHLRCEPVAQAGDGGNLYRMSHCLILAHEDKIYDGATIASLSTPWGEVMSDDDLGGYHLVWTRDMCNSATGLMAAGHHTPPLRALIYLACSQCPDGGFYQNFWISGEPYWRGVQLDEVSFPIMLAWRLHEAGALDGFDPWPMVRIAAGYLIEHGPATPQERWEENGGYSPSTLASNIAGLVCAACFARERRDEVTARFLEDYADFLESHVDRWTVTTAGELVPGIRRHFIRIHPVAPGDPHADEDPNHGWIELRNQPPGAPAGHPAKNIVDAGFLELVRYGIRAPGSDLIEDSLRVIDATLRVDTPYGPCWHRYNNDGYGQRLDGGAFQGWGHGHAWPLLTGERGHYELAAGRSPTPYIHAMEKFATATALLPEQVWDQPDIARSLLFFGRETGAAMPLVWAHAEYIKLVRSAADGRVFDLLPKVAERYLSVTSREPIEIWKFNRQPRFVAAGTRLRVITRTPFRLHWTVNEWQPAMDTDSTHTSVGQNFVDIPVAEGQKAPVRFTFYWLDAGRWEGRDFLVEIA